MNNAWRLADFLGEQHGYDDVLHLEDAAQAALAAELGEYLAERAESNVRCCSTSSAMVLL